MKKDEKKALHTKTAKELAKLQSELEVRLLTTKMEKFSGKLANTSLVKTLSDDLARVKTAQRALEERN